ncbi:MAG: MmgE/PrpD family protein [Chloroflexi bacterium]|nr:MmgE/PrpD family protein [Chloroflexota bacterium]
MNAEYPTRKLADFVVSLRLDSVPEPTRQRAKELIFDAFACALAGHHGEETAQVADLARSLGASREATVIGGEPLSLAGATILNGYLITAVTACDVHRPTNCHIDPEIVPPALAISERDHASGADFLLAAIKGFEIATRVGVALDPAPFRERGWHAPGVIGPFGGAAAVASLRKLNVDQTVSAFGLAGSQSAGTFAAWGTPTVKFHQCRGALSGLLAGLLAEQGFKASPEILVSPDGGLLSSYSNGGKPELITAELGERWELEQIALRNWPGASPFHCLLAALFEGVERFDVTLARVEKIRVAVSPATYAMHGGFDRPVGKFESLLSIHYVVAVALRDRDCWLDQFAPDHYENPELLRFAREQVEVVADPSLSGPTAELTITLRDGTRQNLRRDVPKGDPRDRLSHSELEAKLRKGADGRISASDQNALIERLWTLESVTSVQELLRHCTGAFQTGGSQ